jgi:hypothetical protein
MHVCFDVDAVRTVCWFDYKLCLQCNYQLDCQEEQKERVYVLERGFSCVSVHVLPVKRLLLPASQQLASSRATGPACVVCVGRAGWQDTLSSQG